ncbi:hypothetical protein [Thalassobacillus sp. C254]|uniref:hypothetical protein n=1 Tax=Thalassobacillus sp. C254 TaxID=1225341 RepID=UPI0022B66E02|nr:hypothetical protein [Thalassobacillus sp. C254]
MAVMLMIEAPQRGEQQQQMMLLEEGLQQLEVNERRIFSFFLEVESTKNPTQLTSQYFSISEIETIGIVNKCAVSLHKYVDTRM